MKNMRNLKYEISKWEKIKKKKRKIEIQNIEMNTDIPFQKRVSGPLTTEDLTGLVEMEERKMNYLKKEESYSR